MRVENASADNVPMADTPPESPGGTGVNVIIEIGGLDDSIPIDDAAVSASASAIAAANAPMNTGLCVIP